MKWNEVASEEDLALLSASSTHVCVLHLRTFQPTLHETLGGRFSRKPAVITDKFSPPAHSPPSYFTAIPHPLSVQTFASTDPSHGRSSLSLALSARSTDSYQTLSSRSVVFRFLRTNLAILAFRVHQDHSQEVEPSSKGGIFARANTMSASQSGAGRKVAHGILDTIGTFELLDTVKNDDYQFEGMQFPTASFGTWSKAFCLPQGTTGRKAIKGLMKQLYQDMIEGGEWLYGEHKYDQLSRPEIIDALNDEDETIRERIILPITDARITQEDYNTTNKVYTRLIWHLHELLQLNIGWRQRRYGPNSLYAERTAFPVPLPGFRTALPDRPRAFLYWTLLCEFVAWSLRAKDRDNFLHPSKNEGKKLIDKVQNFQIERARAEEATRAEEAARAQQRAQAEKRAQSEQRTNSTSNVGYGPAAAPEATEDNGFAPLQLRFHLHYRACDTHALNLNSDRARAALQSWSALVAEIRQGIGLPEDIVAIDDVIFDGNGREVSLRDKDDVIRRLLSDHRNDHIELSVFHRLERSPDLTEDAPGWFPALHDKLGRYSCQNGFIPRIQDWQRDKRDQLADWQNAGSPQHVKQAHTDDFGDSEAAKMIADADKKEAEILKGMRRMSRAALSIFARDAYKSSYCDENWIRQRLRALLGDRHEHLVDQLPQTVEGSAGHMLNVPQLGGVVHLLEKDDERGGGILGDTMGLGKTDQVIGALIASDHIHDNILAATDPTIHDRAPIGYFVPSSLAKKTADELHSALGRHYNVYRHGNHPQPCMGKEKHRIRLRKDYAPWKPRRGRAQKRSIVVVPYEQLHPYIDKRGELRGLFHRIVLDEGHFLRFAEQTKRGVVMKAFEAMYTWIVTGSLLVNGLEDARGYLALLEKEHWADAPYPVPFKHRRDRRESNVGRIQRSQRTPLPQTLGKDLKTEAEFARPNPHEPPFNGLDIYNLDDMDEANRKRCAMVRAFNWDIYPYIKAFNNTGDRQYLTTAIQRLDPIMKDLVLARDHDTIWIDKHGNEHKVSERLPEMELERTEMGYDDDEAPLYQAAHMRVSADAPDVDFTPFHTTSDQLPQTVLDGDHDIDDEEAHPPMRNSAASRYVLKNRICTFLAFYAFSFRNTYKWQKYMREYSLVHILWEMRMLKANRIDTRPSPFDDDWQILVQVLFGCPKLRQVLIDIYDTIHGDQAKKKVIIYTQSPQSAEIIEKLCNFMGFSNLLLSSMTEPDSRFDKITKRFNTNTGDCQVLIAPMSLRMLGLNLHEHCSTVFVVEQPFNLSTMMQAVDRIRRYGQEEVQHVRRYHLPGTWMAVLEHRVYLKQYALALLTNAALRTDVAEGDEAAISDALDRAERIAAHGLGAV